MRGCAAEHEQDDSVEDGPPAMVDSDSEDEPEPAAKQPDSDSDEDDSDDDSIEDASKPMGPWWSKNQTPSTSCCP